MNKNRRGKIQQSKDNSNLKKRLHRQVGQQHNTKICKQY